VGQEGGPPELPLLNAELKPSDRVAVTKASQELRLVRPARRNKLQWGER